MVGQIQVLVRLRLIQSRFIQLDLSRRGCGDGMALAIASVPHGIIFQGRELDEVHVSHACRLNLGGLQRRQIYGDQCNAGGIRQHGSQRDNTEVNVRDRSEAAKTPIDQNENQKDIDITANIRKRVVDTKMSVNAQNVKIITQDGKVTLRGPVKSEEEKTQIEKLAHEVAGPANVDNQLEVQP